MMRTDPGRRFRRRVNIIVSIVLGITFGVFVVGLARFSDRSEVAARLHRFGVLATGHVDFHEDVIWVLCGIALGAGVAWRGWRRDGSGQAAGLPKEDVLNRITADPKLRIIGRPERAPNGSAE